MASTNDYLKRYNETENNLVRPNSNIGQGDDYYKLARDQEYGLLFDKEVALENAKSNAMKYTQNQINAQGFGGTGYGSSIQSGIYNTYLSKANEARDDYANNVRSIDIAEQQAMTDQANDRFESITTMLQGADSTQSMNELLSNYGYGEVDSNGNFHWGSKPEGMSDDDWYQMQYYYRLKSNEIKEEEGVTYSTLNDLRNSKYVKPDGTTSTLNNDYYYETDYLWTSALGGSYNPGDVFSITNSKNNTIYLEWTGNGFRQVSENYYYSNEENGWVVEYHEDDKNNKIHVYKQG